MNHFIKFIYTLLFIIITSTTLTIIPAQANEQEYIFLRPKSALDKRYDYHIELAQAALTATENEYGPARIVLSERSYPQQRAFRMLMEGTDLVHIMIRATSTYDEARLDPVRFPLDRGLLGYRIFLIHKENIDNFAKIKTLEDLLQYSVGQGTGWNDVAIYKHNHFRVETSPAYESLFAMLEKKRFDFFSRGVEEAPVEYSAREAIYPFITLENHICLHYPFVRYFWTPNSPKGHELNERLLKGLHKLHKSGKLHKIFYKHKGDALHIARLDKRHIISIDNPFIPESALELQYLWYTPTGH